MMGNHFMLLLLVLLASIVGTVSQCPTSCDDNNPCTVDSCINNACTHTAAANGTSCDDNLWCNGKDVCSSGVCQHLGDPCARGSICSNTCNEETNSCITSAGTSCDDGLYCNGKDTCDGTGNCVHSGNPCSNNLPCNNICSEFNKTCLVPNGTSCSPNMTNCQYVDAACQSGTCVISNSSNCVINGDNSNVISNPNTNHSSPSQVAVIVGSVIGTVVALIVIVVIIVALINRRRARNQTETKINMEVSSDYDSPSSRLPPTGGVASPNIGNLRMMLTPNPERANASPLSVRRAVAYSAVHAERLRMESNAMSIHDLNMGNALGTANFGEVYYATWAKGQGVVDGVVDSGEREVQLALKKLVRPDKFERFRDEVDILRQLSHSNIVRFYGVFCEHNLHDMYIGLEYMNMGSLYDVLQILNDKISSSNMIDMSFDIAIGMSYIEQCNIIHRDISSRNILVSNFGGKYVLKISDFGNAVHLRDGESTYMSNDIIIPIRYSAVEVIRDNIFSSKSDVWSFGVCMWEIFSYGLEPYSSCSDFQVSEYINRGDRLDKPEDMDIDIYNDIITKCWNESPADRPTFQMITDMICKVIRENHDEDEDVEEDDEDVTSTTAADKLQKGHEKTEGRRPPIDDEDDDGETL